MMRTVAIRMIMGVVVLACAGCSAETPTDTPDISDDGIAKLVAGVVGYESTGLSATVTDLITAGSGGTLRQSIVAVPSATTVVTRSDSSFDPGARVQSLAFDCERNGVDAWSAWKLRYAIQFHMPVAGVAGPGIVSPATATTDVEGTYRSSVLTTRGSSHGEFTFDRAPRAGGADLTGSYRWSGSMILRGGREERFDDIVVTCTWNGLHVAAIGGTERYSGRCDVNVRASGPSGVVSRNGTLEFKGGQQATLSIGGRQYLVDVRRGESLRSL